MTITEAITMIDSIKPNTYTHAQKIAWLSTLDEMIKKEIIDTHEGGKAVDFSGYGEDTNINTPLLVPSPYDELYIFWMESKIDYWNGESAKYNNSITMFNNAYASYQEYYNRMHRPLGARRFLF